MKDPSERGSGKQDYAQYLEDSGSNATFGDLLQQQLTPGDSNDS